LPRMRASTRAAMPALICTAVPPAKSMALSLLAIQPPVSAVTPGQTAVVYIETELGLRLAGGGWIEDALPKDNT